MTGDQYLRQILGKYRVDEAAAKMVVEEIYPTVQRWGGEYIIKAEYSGSLAKGTAVSLSTDADVFISLSSATQETLAEIYQTLYDDLTRAGYSCRKQNVSIGVTHKGKKMDFVPGKRQSQYGNDHSLYKNKAHTWTKTNVTEHVNYISKSGRTDEIKLVKIWRSLNQIEFPSFYLEMSVIDALKGYRQGQLDSNFQTVLEFLATDFPSRVYIDPANSNNRISDDLTTAEKSAVANYAQIDADASNWGTIVR